MSHYWNDSEQEDWIMEDGSKIEETMWERHGAWFHKPKHLRNYMNKYK